MLKLAHGRKASTVARWVAIGGSIVTPLCLLPTRGLTQTPPSRVSPAALEERRTAPLAAPARVTTAPAAAVSPAPPETQASPSVFTAATMPNLVGRSIGEARKLIAPLYRLKMVRETFNPSDQPANTIVDQSPRAGSPVTRETTIVLAVSQAPAPPAAAVTRAPTGTRDGVSVPVGSQVEAPTMPYLVGRNIAEARRLLATPYRLNRVREVFHPSDRAADTIVDQSPSAGSPVTRETTISLSVSQGPPKLPADSSRGQQTIPGVVTGRVTGPPGDSGPPHAGHSSGSMPKLIGESLEVARQDLAGVDLAAPNPLHVPSGRPLDEVVEQSPAPGAPLEGHPQVRIWVSDGSYARPAEPAPVATLAEPHVAAPPPPPPRGVEPPPAAPSPRAAPNPAKPALPAAQAVPPAETPGAPPTGDSTRLTAPPPAALLPPAPAAKVQPPQPPPRQIDVARTAALGALLLALAGGVVILALRRLLGIKALLGPIEYAGQSDAAALAGPDVRLNWTVQLEPPASGDGLRDPGPGRIEEASPL
ncbi:PASTA domain-containing protein [Phenylobacterium sp.]|uniref:PASTA domain-containing protein n=1 Tax=Phenylobacterium sp. TaxID=1871053 RepID=UPI002F3FE2FF